MCDTRVGAEVGVVVRGSGVENTGRYWARWSGIILCKGGGNRNFDWDLDSSMGSRVLGGWSGDPV